MVGFERRNLCTDDRFEDPIDINLDLNLNLKNKDIQE